MRVKSFKLKEFFAHTKSRVLGVISRIWISATIDHVLPNPMHLGATHPVSTMKIPSIVHHQTSARFSMPIPQGLTECVDLITAGAHAIPSHSFLSPTGNIWASFKNRKSSKAHIGYVDKPLWSSAWSAMFHTPKVYQRVTGFSVFLAVLCVPCFSQTAGLTPDFVQQFSGNDGLPLAGGLLYPCIAGLACPGNPQVTYTDSSGFTANPSPVVLDANGRPPAGGGVWLNCSSPYKLVLQTSAGVTLKTVDNVNCANGGGGTTSTTYWQLTGTKISNTNAGGTGDVSIGGGLLVSNNINVNGGIAFRSPAGVAHTATITAANVMTADQTWRWPAADAMGCITSDGLGTLSIAPCSGGGGSPGGNTSDIQFNNGGAFSGTDNLQWNNSSQQLILAGVASTPTIISQLGWIQADAGFLAAVTASPSTALAWDIIRAPTGGMHAKSFTADKYVETGSSSGAPTATTGEAGFPHAGAIYCDTSSSPCVEKLYNGSAWITLATGGATSPGGSDTNIQFNSSGSFAGSGNLIWTAGAQKLTVLGSSAALPAIHVSTGFVESDAGFLALPATATSYNAIQAPAGGMKANSFTAATYVQTGNSPGPFTSAPPTPTTADTFVAGAMSFDVASGFERVYNGSAWVSIGGGGGTPGGPTSSVQFNNSGSFLGSANLSWNSGAQLLTVTGIGGTAGLNVVTSYIHSDVGLIASDGGAPTTPLPYNAIQAPFGGLFGQSLRAKNYTTTGSSNGIPAVTLSDAFAPGSMYYDTGLGAERVFNGTSWSTLAAGGVSSVNTLTGSLTIAGTTNQVNVSSVGSTITLSGPQNLNTTAVPTFGGVAAVNFQSSATGGTNAFQVNGGSFVVNGAGAVVMSFMAATVGSSATAIDVTASTGAASLRTIGGISLCRFGGCDSGSALTVNGSTVINSAGYHLGGITTPTTGSGSVVWIGPGGNFWTRPIVNSNGLSCFGIPDGFLALSTSDLYLVACLNSARYRVLLTAY